jgi:hypothetical protein
MLWELAIFELYNICNAPSFLSLQQAACDGKLTRDEYMLRTAQLEYGSHVQTREFYNDTWKAWVRDKGLALQPFVWSEQLPATVQDWQASIRSRMRDTASYPYQPYGRFYDTQVVPYLITTGRVNAWTRALPFLRVAGGLCLLFMFLRCNVLRRFGHRSIIQGSGTTPTE